MEKKHKGRTESVVQPEVTWSANLQQDIVKGGSSYEKSRDRGAEDDEGNGHDSIRKKNKFTAVAFTICHFYHGGPMPYWGQ